MGITFDASTEGVDREQTKADLTADRFDNGRSAEALRLSFQSSQHVAFAYDGAQALYRSLGYEPQPEFWSLAAGRRLDNDANR
jgi:hypothetical protein